MPATTASSILTEIARLREQMTRCESLLADIAKRVNAPDTAAPKLDDGLTIDQFLAELKDGGVKRGRDWLYDQIRQRRVKVLPVGKPYRLPRSEAVRLVRTP